MPYEALTQRQDRLEERARKTAHRRRSYRHSGFALRVVAGILSASFVLVGASGVVGGWRTGEWGAALFIAIFFSGIAFLVSWFPWRRKLRRDREYAYAARELSHERSTRLVLAIQQQSVTDASGFTIRDIMTGMNWDEEAAVDGLAKAIKRGLIYEDFDATLMRYTYRPTSGLSAQLHAHEDFDSRLKRSAPSQAPATSTASEKR